MQVSGCGMGRDLRSHARSPPSYLDRWRRSVVFITIFSYSGFLQKSFLDMQRQRSFLLLNGLKPHLNGICTAEATQPIYFRFFRVGVKIDVCRCIVQNHAGSTWRFAHAQNGTGCQHTVRIKRTCLGQIMVNTRIEITQQMHKEIFISTRD